MARPKKPEKEVRTVLAVRIRPALKAQLGRAAVADHRTTTSLVELILDEWVKARGRRPK
jgi:hypothetical protein